MNNGTVLLKRVDGVQAGQLWPELSRGFQRATPPGPIPGEAIVNNMLTAVMRKAMDCWVIQVKRDGKTRYAGGMLTVVRVDQVTGLRTLLIYSLFTRLMLTEEEWSDGFALLKEAAKAKRCSRISAYTTNENVIAIVNRLGGNTGIRVIELEVTDGS